MPRDNFARMIHEILPEEERPFSNVVVIVMNERTDRLSFSASDALGGIPHPKDVLWSLFTAQKHAEQSIEVAELKQEEED